MVSEAGDCGIAGAERIRMTSHPGDPGSVHVLLGGRKTRVVLTGEIDTELKQDLLDAATDAEAAGRPIEVDVQHVTFMDSTGVAFLAKLSSRSRHRVVVIRPTDLIRFLLDVTSIGSLLDAVDTDPGVDESLPSDVDPDVQALRQGPDPADPGPVA